MLHHFGREVREHVIEESRPVVAWRVWSPGFGKLRRGFGWIEHFRPSLYSVTNWGGMWPERDPMIAKCAADRACVVSLGRECACGLWASKTFQNLMSHNAAGCWPTAVFGQVALWGFAREYEGGFRATCARPVRIWLGNSTGAKWAARLSSGYGIPVDAGLPAELASDLSAPVPDERGTATTRQRAKARTQ